MKITFETLKQVAQERECHVQRMYGGYEWWRDDDHSVVAWCKTIQETYDELLGESLKGGN